MREPRIIGIGGRTGLGKTTLARELVLSRRRVLILESGSAANEYDAVRITKWGDLVRLFKNLPRGASFRVSFAPGSSYFAAACALAWVMAPCTLVMEEAAKYVGHGQKEPRELVELYERGRHAGPNEDGEVSMIVVTQRPKQIPIGLRAEMDRFYAFRLNEQADRDWLAGVPGSSKAIAAMAQNLPPYEYLQIQPDGTVTHERTNP